MEWDQFIFKKISNLIREIRKPKSDPIEDEASVQLDEIKPQLTYLAQMLCGVTIQIHEAEYVGGWKGNIFFLPPKYSHAMDKQKNIDYYIFRVFYLSGQFALAYYPKERQTMSIEEAFKYAIDNSSQIINYLSKQYDQFTVLYNNVLTIELNYQKTKYPNKKTITDWIYGRCFVFEEDDLQNYQQLISPIRKKTVADDKDKEKYTEVKGKNVEQTQILQVNTQEQEEYTLTHNFEKIETLDSFSGRWRNFDGTDEINEHAEALQEVDLRQLVRVDSPVHSIYKSNFVNTMGLLETDISVEQHHFSYPEWDETRKSYKDCYCKIIYTQHTQHNKHETQRLLEKARPEIKQLKRDSERYLSDYFLKKRLPNGDEPDLDAIVDAYIDIYTGKTPSENLYVAKRKKNKDIAILILTDCSLSTDGYVHNQRILDIEKTALLTAAEVWANFNLKFQIDTFSSHTHSQCFYTTYKAFHENWNDVKHRIGAMQSTGYTRIGAALRHATFLLSQVKADKRWLLLLSDGKPNDYDTYEGQYGIHDVKKAIYEAEQKGIFSSAIAIDAYAKFYLPKMFGTSGYTILKHPTQLPETITKFYINLLK